MVNYESLTLSLGFFIYIYPDTPLSLIYTMILNPSENPILFYVSRRYFSHNSHKNTVDNTGANVVILMCRSLGVLCRNLLRI